MPLTIGNVLERPGFVVDRYVVTEEVRTAGDGVYAGETLFVAKAIHSQAIGELRPEDSNGVYVWTSEAGLPGEKTPYIIIQ